MMEMIERFWNGDFVPCQGLGKKNEEICQLETLLAENRRRLEEDLNEEQKQRWERVLECFEEYLFLLGGEAFERGFTIGTRLTAETFLSGCEQ
ncbi:MAG: hypothetical protein IKL99_00345 [Oscillospiraceae bacterium]|nr:hypothetical protein [Oscillospiraceae bacterium]